jgi:hypothetical protein
MGKTYQITEAGIPRQIPLDGPTVFAWPDGHLVIQYWPHKAGQSQPIHPDQSFMEVVRLRQAARATE